MKLSAIRDLCREKLKDLAKPYLWSDEWLNDKINDAEREACIRARLIVDSSSPITSIAVVAGTKSYKIDARILDVMYCELESRPGVPAAGWTLTETELVLSEAPRRDDVMLMTVVRLPMADIAGDDKSPEIRSHHHARLADWALAESYMVHDADGFDPKAADAHYALFERNFGPRPTANVQRKHRQKHARVTSMAKGW